MDRAAKAVRRSGVKLLSLGGGHSDLNMVISETKDVKNSAKSFMAAQNSAAQYLMKWAANEENRAIQDVSSQIVELNVVWTEAQREFAEQLKEFKQMFENLLEGEKHIDQAKTNLITCEQRELRIKKELKKAAKKATAEEIRQLENRLIQAERQKDLAQLEVEDRIRENEAIKVIRLKEGFHKLSEAYVELGRKCTIIFEAQRDIAFQLPDAQDRDLEEIKYTGSGATKRYVTLAKEKVKQYKRQQQMQQTTTLPISMTEPPPPYTPGNYFVQDMSVDETLINPAVITTESQALTTAFTAVPIDVTLYQEDLNSNLQVNLQQIPTTNLQRSSPRPPHLRSAPPPRQQSVDPPEDLEWGSEDEDGDLSGAMGGMKL